MQARWGTGYLFDVDATMLTGGQKLVWNRGGQPKSYQARVGIHGYLTTSSQGATGETAQDQLAAAENTLRSALLVPFQDLVFVTDDDTVTPLSLLNARSITGVRCVEGPELAETRGPEFCTLRTFTCAFMAEYPLNNPPRFTEFSESLTFSGGGPVYAFRRNILGVPQKQMIWPATEYELVQSGRLSGYLSYPPVNLIPGAKFPGALLSAGVIKKEDPERKGPNGWEGYPITWEYHMAASTAFPSSAVPTLWNF